ncbi:hypothetical protein U0L90_07675 [Flavobacteriaceae sp. LMIT009]
MSDKLNNIQDNGFKVPKDYFNSLEEKIFANAYLDEAVQGENSTGFDVPKGYFDSLENEIISKLPQTETKVISLFSKTNLVYISGAAAAVLIMFAVFINQTNVENINDLDVELVENYMLEEDLDTYELASLLTEEEITTINTDIFTETYDDAILEDYLLENADLEDIMDQ